VRIQNVATGDVLDLDKSETTISNPSVYSWDTGTMMFDSGLSVVRVFVKSDGADFADLYSLSGFTGV
jgi:hypothetical protein